MNGGPTAVNRSPEIRPIGGKDNLHLKANDTDHNTKSSSLTQRIQDKPSSSETRPKEGATSNLCLYDDHMLHLGSWILVFKFCFGVYGIQ